MFLNFLEKDLKMFEKDFKMLEKDSKNARYIRCSAHGSLHVCTLEEH